MLILTVISLFYLQFNYAFAGDPIFKVKLNERGQFVDNYGRVRLFHGFNSVMKKFPWYDIQIYNETRLKLYKEWGFNVVRLGTMWSGAQPTETKFNETYINFMRSVVKRLSNYGMYAFLDMHQDVLSSEFTTYDGAPLWLIKKFPPVGADQKFPLPLSPNKTYVWPTYYISYATCAAFQNLYTSEIGLSSWINFWQKIVTSFKDLTSVMGYELINEPWVGDFYDKPSLLLPGNAGRYNLLPAYDKLVANIRKIDNDTLIFYEPVTLGAYLPTTGAWGTGFNRVPGGQSEVHRSVLSYHYYCFFLTTGNPADNFTEPKRFICDNVFAAQLFNSTVENVKKTGGGSFLTEFGGCQPDGNPNSINTVECDTVLSFADKNYQSYTYWDSIFFDAGGHARETVIQTLARTYPRAVQGQPINYNFNRVNAHFTLSYSIDYKIKAPTEVFIPITVHYPNGFTVSTLPPEIKTVFNASDYTLSILPESSKVGQGAVVFVIIVPK